ncbi:MAG TPA: sugar kinase [Roseiflexaceae bacterium]|nr:sugar kinase [Roseiflexaceae bacterium]
MIDILVLGELNADLILRGDVVPEWNQAEKLIDDAALTLGSSSAIFACGAARLGLRVAFVGVTGDDLLGRFCREALEARGVDTSGVVVDPALRTGMTVILQLPDDRAMLTFPGAIPMLRADMVGPQLLAAARHIHVGSYFWQTALQPGLPALFAQARARGATTSLDTQWDPSGAWAGLDELLAATDILLPNEAEACALARAANWRQALEALASRVPTVAVKRGAGGAAAMRGETFAEAAPPAVTVVDAVGAGDSFDAGFIYGALAGWSLANSLALAVACGALSTRAAGGTAAQPTLGEALAIRQ